MSDEQVIDESVVSPEGVAPDEGAVDTTDAGVAEAFQFSWKDDSGEERVFKKPGELADFIRHTGMTRKQYEAEMGKVTERMRQLEEMEKRYQAKDLTASQLAGRYQPIDELMKRNPQFEQAVTQLYDRLVKGAPSDPKDLFRQMIKEELKPIEEWKTESEKEREASRQRAAREAAVARLREAEPGFDEKLVENYLRSYEDYPPEEQQYAALKVAWDAVRGSTSAAELERRAALHKTATAGATSTPGAASTEVDVSNMNDEELYQAALKEIGG